MKRYTIYRHYSTHFTHKFFTLNNKPLILKKKKKKIHNYVTTSHSTGTFTLTLNYLCLWIPNFYKYRPSS